LNDPKGKKRLGNFNADVYTANQSHEVIVNQISNNNSFVQRKDNYNSHDKSINFKSDIESHPSPKRFTEGEQVLKVTQDF
jgi:hypothetical protein